MNVSDTVRVRYPRADGIQYWDMVGTVTEICSEDVVRVRLEDLGGDTGFYAEELEKVR